jgi:ribosomal protein S27E
MAQASIKSKFLEILCPRCKTPKTTFGKAATRIKCDKCNYLLVKTGGGKAKVRAAIRRVIWS